ncbi:restriction endonuclease subunit S [Empedobacter falsenii]
MNNDNTLIPKYRFPAFKDEGNWSTYSISEISEFRRGSFPQPYGLPEWYDKINGFPFIQVFDVDENLKLKPFTKNKISLAAANQSVFIKAGTLIVTLQGSIGRVAITQYDAYIDRTLLIFDDYKIDIDKYFYAYIIKLIFEIEKEKAPGGIIKTITKEVLSKFIVKIPSNPSEQQKIAACLSSLDDVIAGHEEKLTALEEHKKGLMQNLFPQEGETKPKYRFPDFENDGDWVEKKLGDIANRITLKNKNSQITQIFTNSAEHGIVNQRDFFDKDIANQSNIEGYYIVEPGDFVYNPRVSSFAPVGPIAKNNKNYAGAVSPLYTVFRFINPINDFYVYYFKTKHWFNAIRKIANTGARFDRMSITASQFMEIEVLMTSIKEQQKIASVLSSVDELIVAQREKIEALKAHKKGLMQGLFPKIES